MTLPRISAQTARHHFLASHLLAQRPTGPGNMASLQDILKCLTFVQLDSINTVSRAHHMILHARLNAYRPKLLDRYLKQRHGFEHWTHDASLIDMEHYPIWKHKFERDQERIKSRWTNWRRPGFTEKFDEILNHIATHGACGSSDVGKDEASGSSGWWDWKPSKTALEYLWRSGQISVCHRESFRKMYDLTERVVPKHHLAKSLSEPEAVDQTCQIALDRLGFATSGEIAAFWDIVTPAEAKAWCSSQLADGALVEVEIEALDGKLKKAFVRPEFLDRSAPEISSHMRILSPFDPMIRNRDRTERLFGFEYRIEVFVPEAKRKYGYYVFPILEGDKFIGRVDMKADRAADLMRVRAFWPEQGVRLGKGRVAKLEQAIARTAQLSEVSDVSYEKDWIRSPVS